MTRIGPIARLMIAMALIGLDLAFVRSWWLGLTQIPPGAVPPLFRPVDDPPYFLGEISPMASLALIGLAAAVVGRRRWRRFGLGMALTALGVALLFLVSPSVTRHAVHAKVVRPVEFRLYRLGYCSPGSATIDEILVLQDDSHVRMHYWHGRQHYWNGPVRCPFFHINGQIIVGVLQFPFALIGGLTAAFWGRSTTRSVIDPPGSLSRSDLGSRPEPAESP